MVFDMMKRELRELVDLSANDRMGHVGRVWEGESLGRFG